MAKKPPIPLDYEEPSQVDDSVAWQDLARMAIKLAFIALMTLAVMGFLGLFSVGY